MNVPNRMPVLMFTLMSGPKIPISLLGTVSIKKDVPATCKMPMLRPKKNRPTQMKTIFSMSDPPTEAKPITLAKMSDLR